MKKLLLVFFLMFTFVSTMVAAPPVPFSGKLAVDGKNFQGSALFAFSIIDGEGAVHWKHATENNATIENFVLNGRYLVLLGGQGMQPLPANLFLENDNLFLRIRVDLQDGQGIRLLEPDQPITSTPYALAAELARLAEKASIADGVTPGAITAGMIDKELLADLNKTITISDLPEEVVKSMNRPITREMLPQDVRHDLNRTIGVAQLSAEVNEKLNRDFTIQPGSISKSLLGQDVLGDLNRTILRHHLSEELRAELNRTITKSMLSEEIKDDLNRTIGVAQLSAEVNEKLNRDFTIQPGSISKSLLGQDVLGDLNRTILRHHLSEELRAELNRTIRLRDLAPEVIADLNDSIAPGSITLNMLASGVRADLNRTITKSMLAEDIKNDLNRTITLGDLAPEVIADLNDSIQQGSITLDLLSSQIRNDLNRTITKSMLSQEVLDELNATIGPSKLSSEVSSALKPVVIGQPSSVVEVGGNPAYLAVDATGVNLSYQWKKDGVDVAGATSHTLSIADLNASQHEGNYTVVVSNTFGSVTSSVAQIDVNGSLNEGLMGWWKFDETEGNIAYDSSGNDRDGNFSAGGTWADGKIGGALDLNVSTSVEIHSYKGVLGTTARSFSGWFKILSLAHNGAHGIFGWGESTNRYGLWRDANGYLKLAISGGYITSTSMIDSEWFHLVVTSEGNSNISDSKIFLNSVEEDIRESVARLINTVSDRDVYLGGEWKGYIDDIRIYDRALSALEVKALYELGEQPFQENGSGATTVVNGTVADGSITTNQLSEQILKYLKPEITTQPQPIASTIFADTNASLSVSAEGKYLTYQWKRNGTALTGETNASLTITDANATQHDGNYTVVVSNDFGSVESGKVEILINHSLLDGLIAWWKFDETSGTVAYDSSGNGHDANLTNGPTWVTGKIGGALSFDGSDDMVRTGVSGMYNQDFTWSTWIKTSHTSGAVVGVSADSWSGGGSSLYIFGGKPKIDVCNIGNKLGSLSINTNQWVHYLLTVEDSGGSSDPVKIFVNGQINVDSQMNWFGLNGQAFKLRIGHVPVHGDYYSGIIDDVRIYDRVLSNAEVQDLYQLGQ